MLTALGIVSEVTVAEVSMVKKPSHCSQGLSVKWENLSRKGRGSLDKENQARLS